MHCELFVVAESAAIDIGTNRLSIFNIWDEINTPSVPAFVPSMSLVTTFSREESEPNEAELQIMVTMNGQAVVQLPMTVNFQDKPRTRVLVGLQGMVFPTQGVCNIVIRQGDAPPMAEWKVRVNLIANPQIQTVEAAPASSPG